MDCPWCGHSYRDGALFCGDCGRGVVFDARCDQCGATNPSGAAFCDACGHPTTAGASPAATSLRPEVAAPDESGVPLPAVLGRITARSGLLTAAGIALILVLTAAVVLRTANLGTVPPNVTADEADNLQVVYHILAGTGPGFFGLDWKPAPAFSVYIIAGFMRVFGESIVGLRMATVLLSVAAIAVFYPLARRSLSRGAALSAAFLMATGLWFLHFSRSGWENAHVTLYAALAALFLTLAVRRGGWYLYALAGLAAALGVYGYSGGRAIIIGVLAFLPVALVMYPQARRRTLIGYGILLVLFAAVIAPQVNTALDDWDYFNRRTESVSVLLHADEYRGDRGLPSVLAHQVWRTIDGFFLLDSGVSGVGLNSRYLPHGWPVLDRVTGLLFWLGLIVSLRRLRDTALWWIMLLALLFPVQVLSTGTPDAARAVGSIPFYYLFVGMGLHWLLGLRVAPRLALRGVAVVVVLAVGFYNVAEYYRWMDEPHAAASRQPAVEADEFELWQAMQIAEAEAGGWGFNVGQWHQMRERLRP